MADLGQILRNPARLAALQRTALLDTPSGDPFDHITRLAAHSLHVPGAIITLVDAERQFFVSSFGLPEPWASYRETPLSHSFCQHTVARAEPLVVGDARTDSGLCDNGAVREMGVVAYAGFPLYEQSGHVLGSFAVFDSRPHPWTDTELSLAREFAELTQVEIDRHRVMAGQHGQQAALAHLVAMIQEAPDPVATFDANQRLLFVNPAGRKLLLGGREPTREGPTMRSIFPDAEYQRLADDVLAVVHEHGSWRGESTVRTREGTEAPVAMTMLAHRDAGAISFYSVILRDISAEQRAQQELRESEQLMRSIVESVSNGIIVYDR
jgi:PAS domain S-box-containing protein